jgi:large conductance mechanosensitive channel
LTNAGVSSALAPTGQALLVGLCRIGDCRRFVSPAQGKGIGMLKEFRDFAMRGNVIDLAVGIIIGAAFTGIVTSLVNDVIMPVIGALLKGVDFSNYFFVLTNGHGDGNYSTLKTAKDAGAATINYGVFLNTIINFIIVAFVIFIVVKQINRFRKEAPPAGPTKSEELLTEIRDLLKSRP